MATSSRMASNASDGGDQKPLTATFAAGKRAAMTARNARAAQAEKVNAGPMNLPAAADLPFDPQADADAADVGRGVIGGGEPGHLPLVVAVGVLRYFGSQTRKYCQVRLMQTTMTVRTASMRRKGPPRELGVVSGRRADPD